MHCHTNSNTVEMKKIVDTLMHKTHTCLIIVLITIVTVIYGAMHGSDHEEYEPSPSQTFLTSLARELVTNNTSIKQKIEEKTPYSASTGYHEELSPNEQGLRCFLPLTYFYSLVRTTDKKYVVTIMRPMVDTDGGSLGATTEKYLYSDNLDGSFNRKYVISRRCTAPLAADKISLFSISEKYRRKYAILKVGSPYSD